MIWALIGATVVVASVLVVVGVGSRLPRDHVASARIRFAASPATVWAVISAPLAAGSWRKGVKRVEPLPDRDGHPVWREVSGSGSVTFTLAESTPERSMTTRIVDDGLPFGGQWEFTLAVSGSGSELSITERGFVKPALFRFMARYVLGYTSTITEYLGMLAARLGESTMPEVTATGR